MKADFKKWLADRGITYEEYIHLFVSNKVELNNQFAQDYHKEQLRLFFMGKVKCECGTKSTGDMQFDLCNICGKPIIQR